MAIIRPFQALRPVPELAKEVAALPYDVLTTAEARILAQDHPHSFLHVTTAEIDLDPATATNDPRVYAKARENLDRLIADGVLVPEAAACFYIYREAAGAHAQIGLAGCTAIDDYLAGVIKIHEQTRPAQEQERTHYVASCDANTCPIFLTYRSQPAISQLLDAWIAQHAPIYDFTADDGVQHTVWVLDHPATMQRLTALFAAVPALYVADGHHRSASAVNVGKLKRQQHPAYTGDEEFNYFLSVLFPGDQLAILDYNRVVKDLHGLSVPEFLAKVGAQFEIAPHPGPGPYKPAKRRTFGMYLAGQWHRLTPKLGTYDEADPVAGLDVSILQNNLLRPILGIQDPKTDERIEFVGGIRGLAELERRVAQGMTVAFALYPTSIAEMMAIADAGQLMPPKSTWFEPKLRSGLFIHRLS